MKKYFLFVCITFLFFSCKKEISLEILSENFTETQLAICNNEPCSKIAIDYVLVSGEAEISDKINNSIKKSIIKTLFLGEDENPSAQTIEDASKQFIVAYRDHKNEYEYETSYEAEITVTEIFQHKNVLSLEFQSYLFTGGAHGYGSTHFKNFDKQTGEEISVESSFKDYDAFLKFAEAAFRKEQKIENGVSINNTGFLFENDTFWLPKSMGITEKEMVFMYNPYDIASYAEGPIVFTIPLKSVKPYLSISL